ncbi:MAG: CsgG/HfaB family protein [Bacteroidota bacterium]
MTTDTTSSRTGSILDVIVPLIVGGLVIWFLWWLIFGGEDPPYYPRIVYETVDEVLINEINVNSNKTKLGSIFGQNQKIAILNFKSPENTQGGVLVSDIFSTVLQRKGFDVVERDNIEQILNEQNLVNSGKTSLSDLEIASKLGRLLSADYMIFGAVTIYDSKGQRIYLPVHIHKDDRDVYQEKYTKYRNWYTEKFWPLWDSKKERVEKIRVNQKVLSVQELEEELKKTSIEKFSIVATVGVSAKIVDVKTAKILWMGQAETNDFTLVDASNRIINDFIEDIQKEN